MRQHNSEYGFIPEPFGRIGEGCCWIIILVIVVSIVMFLLGGLLNETP